MEWLIWLIMSVSFVFIGLSVHVFKWYFLIAGYNTMSKEEKANVDIESVARIMGYWGYFNGVLFLIVTLLSTLGVEICTNGRADYFWRIHSVPADLSPKI